MVKTPSNLYRIEVTKSSKFGLSKGMAFSTLVTDKYKLALKRYQVCFFREKKLSKKFTIDSNANAAAVCIG
jgi:hypothetical protein